MILCFETDPRPRDLRHRQRSALRGYWVRSSSTLSSDFAWSNRVGEASSEAWGFDSINGEKASLIRTVSVSKRALCVCAVPENERGQFGLQRVTRGEQE